VKNISQDALFSNIYSRLKTKFYYLEKFISVCSVCYCNDSSVLTVIPLIRTVQCKFVTAVTGNR